MVRTAQATVPGQVGHASWIDTDDLDVWPIGSPNEAHYNTQGQIGLGIRFANQFTPAPEPSALLMIGTGLLALAGYRWWKQVRGRQARQSNSRVLAADPLTQSTLYGP